jgi:hypothetical protein
MSDERLKGITLYAESAVAQEIAADLLALRTALAALTEEATVRGQRAHNQGVILVCNHFAARIRELLEDRQ